MGWETIVALILSQGLPLAEKLWQKWAAGNPPTQSDWDELIALGKIFARQQMMLALARNGVDPSSPQGLAFLALTPP